MAPFPNMNNEGDDREMVLQHREICEKTSGKKRKAFDMTKHRAQGTELEQFAKKAGGGGRGRMGKVSKSHTNLK